MAGKPLLFFLLVVETLSNFVFSLKNTLGAIYKFKKKKCFCPVLQIVFLCYRVEEGSPNLKPPVEVVELKERVVLITFSSTDLHVVNASQSNIAILCANPKQQRYRSNMEPICQPELAAQQKSRKLF